MSAGLPNAALAELYVATTAGEVIVLLTVTHADLAQPLRLVTYAQDVVSGGNTFTAFPMDVRLPADRDEPPHAQLIICAVDRSVIQAIRSITSPAVVTLQAIRPAAPNTILRTWTMELRQATYTATEVVLDLYPDPVLEESYPGTDHTPLAFPAMFDR